MPAGNSCPTSLPSSSNPAKSRSACTTVLCSPVPELDCVCSGLLEIADPLEDPLRLTLTDPPVDDPPLGVPPEDMSDLSCSASPALTMRTLRRGPGFDTSRASPVLELRTAPGAPSASPAEPTLFAIAAG